MEDGSLGEFTTVNSVFGLGVYRSVPLSQLAPVLKRLSRTPNVNRNAPQGSAIRSESRTTARAADQASREACRGLRGMPRVASKARRD